MEKLQFSVSSELKNIIGRELITDDFIAISELVKNSFDANAKKVEIVFENTKNNEKDATIEVIDDGDGMTYEDLRNKWLLVAYSKKVELQKELRDEDYRNKIGKRRIFAGAKGIGRFSCDKLGSKLDLLTKSETEKFVNILKMDWNKFEENPNTKFQEIDVIYEQTSVNSDKIPRKIKKGTVLRISCLRDQWDRLKILKLKRHLQRLINPAQIDPSQEFSIYIEAKEYKEDDKKYKPEEDSEIVNGFVRNVLFENLGIKTTQINVKVDKEKICTELSDKGEFIYRLEEDNEYKPLQEINIRIFFLNPVAKSAFTKIMGIEPVNYGSVFFYRNGIKVNPYGNEGDDWLGLDRRKTQGTRRFLGNRDLMGRIEVSGYQPAFREVSSRDRGLVETEEYKLLKDLFEDKALKRLEKFVIEGINWDSEKHPKDPEEVKADSFEIISQLIGKTKKEVRNIEFNRNLLEIFAEKQIEKTPEIIDNIDSVRKIVENKEDKAYIDLQVKAVRSAFRSLQKAKKDLEKELQQKELFLQYVAQEDTGDIAALQHQIGLCTDVINSHIISLKGRIERKEQISNKSLEDLVDAVLMQTQIINSIASFLPSAKFEKRAQEITSDLVSYVRQYVEKIYVPLNEAKLKKQGANVNVIINDDATFECTFNPYKFVIIIDNLISNSIKAHAQNIIITMSAQDKKTLVLKVTDDGDGISNEVLPKVFSFGFSSTGGTGIGLHHVKEIVENDGGSIFINNKLKKGVEFIIEVKKPC